MVPLTSPTSVHRLAVSITQALCAMQIMGSGPLASSDDALETFGPVCTVAINRLAIATKS